MANCPGTAESVPDEYIAPLLPIFAELFGNPDMTLEDLRDFLAMVDADGDAPPGIACVSAPCSFQVPVDARPFDGALVSRPPAREAGHQSL